MVKFDKELKSLFLTFFNLLFIIIPIIISVKFVSQINFWALITGRFDSLNVDAKIWGLFISLAVLFLGLFLREYKIK